jgi:hypothetical protein
MEMTGENMLFWYDCEFLEDGRTIDMISIGIVAQDGREYYAVNKDAPWRRIRHHKWLMENVVPGLPKAHGDWRQEMPKSWLFNHLDPAVRRRHVIAQEVREFLTAGLAAGERAQLWGYFSAYDHVLLAQLWGPMMALPAGVPMLTCDIEQEAMRLEVEGLLPEHTGRAHNALDDARWNRAAWEFVQGQAALSLGGAGAL